MNSHARSLGREIQLRFDALTGECREKVQLLDLVPLNMKSGITRQLMMAIVRAVDRHYEGLTDCNLLKELESLRFACCPTTVTRAGTKLVEKGLIRREEWEERSYDDGGSRTKRYRYFPVKKKPRFLADILRKSLQIL
jgi:hypothetical protein